MQSKLSRRSFLQSTAAISFPTIVSATALGGNAKAAANSRIQVGVIGLGSRGFNLVDECLKLDDVQIVALCDVDPFHHRDRPWGTGPAYGLKPGLQRVSRAYAKNKSGKAASGIQTTSDFREICERKDIDAVVVATPDHWHALCTITALKNGKDVYCEKPVTHLFREGQLVIEEVARQKAVFQTGSQQRSANEFRQAVEVVRNGHLGKVTRVEVGLPPGYEKPMGDASVTSPPEHIDYDLWCGPSPALPYMRARHHRWWRGHRAYGGGVLMDWIGHHNDIAHWALDVDRSGPTRVEAVNWTKPNTDVYDTPHHYEIHSQYPGDVIISISSRHKQGVKFIGDEGWLYVTRGRMNATNKAWTKLNFDAGSVKVARSPGHMKDFVNCMRSRKKCICPAEIAHRSITPGHLGFVSNALSRVLQWDADQEKVVGDDAANQLLSKIKYREPWTLDV
ncbi:MAG: dehydrogenase [Planctomycetaceae bacterium]|nr:dehydrogenase [Planctomycetaceae bacterium]